MEVSDLRHGVQVPQAKKERGGTFEGTEIAGEVQSNGTPEQVGGHCPEMCEENAGW